MSDEMPLVNALRELQDPPEFQSMIFWGAYERDLIGSSWTRSITGDPMVKEVSTVTMDEVELPSRFTLMIERKADVGVASPLNPWCMIQFSVRPDRKQPIRAEQVRVAAGDVTDVLDALLASRPMSWWKQRALFLIQARDAAEHQARRVAILSEASENSQLMPGALLALMPFVRAGNLLPGFQDARRDRITPELLKEVAVVYREAYQAGANPTQAVAHRFGKARQTAARWVNLARKEGYLRPARGTTGGEVDD